MSLCVAFQMDPIGEVDRAVDSTFVLALEAMARGYTVHVYQPGDLVLETDGVVAMARQLLDITPAEEPSPEKPPVVLASPARLPLAEMDIVWMRQDPPFDMAYLAATYLLELLPRRTLVLNDPAGVRNSPEKLSILNFPELIPPTLVSRNIHALRRFREQHRDIIVKPLNGNGGAGIFHLTPQDENFATLIEMFFQSSREPLMLQAYLPAVREGDRRVVLADGDIAGAFNRCPPPGELRANLHAGGRAGPVTLTEREMRICRTIAPFLRERGLLFAGIDIIGGFLTEINVTSPTGLREIAALEGTHPGGLVWDAALARLHARRQGGAGQG